MLCSRMPWAPCCVRQDRGYLAVFEKIVSNHVVFDKTDGGHAVFVKTVD